MTPARTQMCRIFAVIAMLWTTACDELSARRQIQKAGELFNDGEYAEALEEYEEALEKAPDLQTGHHNAAICAYRAFQPGVPTEKNKYYAERAAYHFKVYLDAHPDDEEIVDLLTNVWLDSDRHEEALDYWKARQQKTPKDLGVLEKLGTINRQAGNYEDALKCDYQRAELAPNEAGRLKALLDIGGLQLSRLNNTEMVDAERLAIADEGITALKKALKAQPKNPTVHSVLGSLYQFRSVTHYAGWARIVDAASQRRYQLAYSELKKAQQAKAGGKQGKDKAPSLGQNKEKPGE